MPRRPRIHVPDGYYHVTLRGNHQHAIFARASDRDRLDDIVAAALDASRAVLHAYCWMTNHVHMLVQISETPLGSLMQRIASRYARYFQGSFGITGHLFERRHHALLVVRDSHLVELVRYIHLNPVRAGMVAHAGEYGWSSHAAYLGLTASGWVRTDKVLAAFGADLPIARSRYQRFIEQGEASGIAFPLVASSTPVLVASPVIAVAPPPFENGRGGGSLEDLIDQICVQERCLRAEVLSPSRAAHLVHARARIAREAVALEVASIKEVARTLGRTPAAILWLLRRPSNDRTNEVT